jgi:hypothetical protein
MRTLSPRQVHLDFHTPAWAEGVGADFDADAFAATLANAGVTSITCFARCHHGLCYYPSRANPELVHPNLAVPDLLGPQVEACHARGIRVPAYTTVQWDQRQAQDHPEWVLTGENGGPTGPGGRPLEPGFYAFLDVFHPGYRAFLKQHVADLLELVPAIDGLFFDIVQPRSSLAPHWRAAMDEAGVDPADPAGRGRFAVRVYDDWKQEMSVFCRSLPQWTDDKTIFYNAGHVGPADAASAGAITHHEVESLPGGAWGYGHFPTAHAYARTTDKPSLAMTGRFHTSWGDFGSYRRPAALEYECLRAMAEGAAGVSVGDQLHPSGRLDSATYELIGGAFDKLKDVEPIVAGGRLVREVAILTPEAFDAETGEGAMGGKVGEADTGAVALLTTLHRHADRITPSDEFGGYAAVVLPDRVPADAALAAKLRAYHDAGGTVVMSGHCGAAAALAGVTLGGEARPLDYVRPIGGRTEVMYEGATPIAEVADDTEVVADALPPLADRTWRHYFGHRHAPAAEQPYQPAAVRRGRCTYLAHRVFEQWHRYAHTPCLDLVRQALASTDPILTIDGGPSTLEARLLACPDGGHVLSLLYYPPARRAAGGPGYAQPFDIIESVVPIVVPRVRVKLPDREPHVLNDVAVAGHRFIELPA